MINKVDHPVAWCLLCYELDDAREHIEKLLHVMSSDAEFDETEFRISLGHIAAHLNRAWNARDVEEELTEEQWDSFRRYPLDLEPIA